MYNQVKTHAYYWHNSKELPTYREMILRYADDELLVKVNFAMFGKALYRAVKSGHPVIKPPRVLGTLLAGEVLNDVAPFCCGMKVVINPHADVGDCSRCAMGTRVHCKAKLSLHPGAISEFVCISGCLQQGVFQIPPNVNPEEAVYCELIACGQESIRKASTGADQLIIIGCGLMALLQIQLAKLQGFRRVVCIYNHDEREEMINSLGAIPLRYSSEIGTIRSELAQHLSGGNLAIIDSAGTALSVQVAVELAAANSTVILFSSYAPGSSYQLDLNKIHYQNIQLVGSYHFPNEKFSDVLRLMSDKKIDIASLITNRINWRDIDCVYDTFSNNSISSIITF